MDLGQDDGEIRPEDEEEEDDGNHSAAGRRIRRARLFSPAGYRYRDARHRIGARSYHASRPRPLAIMRTLYPSQ